MTSHTHEPHDPATEAIGPSAPSEVLDASPRGRRRYLWAAIGVLALIVGGMYLSRQFGDPGPNEGATDRPDRVLEALNCKPGARYVDLAGAPPDLPPDPLAARTCPSESRPRVPAESLTQDVGRMVDLIREAAAQGDSPICTDIGCPEVRLQVAFADGSIRQVVLVDDPACDRIQVGQEIIGHGATGVLGELVRQYEDEHGIVFTLAAGRALSQRDQPGFTRPDR